MNAPAEPRPDPPHDGADDDMGAPRPRTNGVAFGLNPDAPPPALKLLSNRKSCGAVLWD